MPAGDNLHNPLLSLLPLVRYLIVGTPYLLSTILMGLIYKDKKREERGELTNNVDMQTALRVAWMGPGMVVADDPVGCPLG